MKASYLWCIYFALLVNYCPVVAGDWSSHDDLSFAPSAYLGEANLPQLGVANNGDAIAVWASQESSGNVVKASHYDAETKQWSFPKKIGSDASEGPRLAVAPDGRAMAVWKKQVNGLGILYFNAYQKEEWQGESLIDSSKISNDSHPSIGVDGLGKAFVVWQSQSDKADCGSMASVIRSSCFNFTTSSWGPIVNLSKDYSSEGHAFVGQPEIAVNSSGNAIAVWRYCDAGKTAAPFRIQCNSYRLNSWEKETDVSTSPTAQLIQPMVAISAKGNALAIWLQTGSNYYVVTAAIKTEKWNSSTALSAVGYVKNPISADQNLTLTHAAFDKKENAIAVWSYIDEAPDLPIRQIQARTYQHPMWGKTSTLSDFAVPGSAKIAFDPLGSAWAIFTSQGFSGDSRSFSSILAAKFIHGIEVWCIPECLSTEMNNSFPNLSANCNGNFHSVWVAEKQGVGIIQASNWDVILPPPPPPPPPPPIPLPPAHVKGMQMRNDFATHSDRVNIITWEAPTGGAAPAYYRIYRDSAFKEIIAEIPAEGKLKFVDPNRKKGKEYTYYIITFDRENKKSQPIRLVIPPAK